MFSASDVKALREKTGAGMLDCKKALDACNGEIEKAIDWLREKGIAKASKKGSRIAAEGISKILINKNEAIIFEVNSETDFVAKNDEFINFVNNLGEGLLNSKANTLEEALLVLIDGISVNDMVVNITAKIGEKITLRRFNRVIINNDECFGDYIHMGGKIASLVVIEGNNEEVAKDVAMHVAAMHPLYVNSGEIPSEVLDKEKEVMHQELLNEGKPEDKIEKILVGKMHKYYEEVCLLDQIFIKAENKESVRKYLEDNHSSLKSMIRYEVGEGIEKKKEDFREEVMSQIHG